MDIKVNSKSYKIKKAVTTLLEALTYIQENIEPTLAFDYGCKSGVCGACSVRVNGNEQLACSYTPADGDTIEPIRYAKQRRDLLVDKSIAKSLIAKTKATIHSYKEEVLGVADEKKSEVQSNCILCSSCYSACPVVEVKPNFLGPYALTKTYKYTIDKREGEPKEHIDAIQSSGIWDCTLCNECTLACPQGIDPKSDIVNLRNLSASYGYMDPNFSNMGFSGGFGFDPNGGF